jgi:ribosomal protein S18 acetylase RimI-like enzyme
MRFVKATREDAREITALYRNAIGSPGCTWSASYPNADITRGDLNRQALFCLKNEADEIIGAISIDDDALVEALDCWEEAWKPGAELARLVVREEYQNQGVARQLIRCAMEELACRGYRSVHFLVSKTHQRALRSYEKLNFTLRGETELYDTLFLCYEKQLDKEELGMST